MFETEIPPPREQKGPGWVYLLVGGGYLGLTILDLMFRPHDFDHVVQIVEGGILAVVFLVQYRRFTSKPDKVKVLDI